MKPFFFFLFFLSVFLFLSSVAFVDWEATKYNELFDILVSRSLL